MNDFIKRHWKLLSTIATGAFAVWGTWVMLKADVKSLKAEMPIVQAEVSSLKEFRSAQIVVNTTMEKSLDKIDRKMDRVLERLPSRR